MRLFSALRTLPKQRKVEADCKLLHLCVCVCVFWCDLTPSLLSITRVCKMFPPKTRADVGMVQCVADGHGKPPGRKTVETRRRAGPCKKEG